MIISIDIVSKIIMIVSSTFTSKILPNKKLKISIVKPPDMLIRMRPIEIPEDNKIATEDSPDISNFFFIFVIIIALDNEII